MNDYLDYNDADDREDFTNEVFTSYTKFEKEIRKVFSDVDKKLYAQERLSRLT